MDPCTVASDWCMRRRPKMEEKELFKSFMEVCSTIWQYSCWRKLCPLLLGCMMSGCQHALRCPQDYNTCTLPHTKYYDLEVYEKKKAARAAKKGVDPKVWLCCDSMTTHSECSNSILAR